MTDRKTIEGKPERQIIKYGESGSGAYPVSEAVALKALRFRMEAERADPDLARKRAKEASDLSAKYARMNGRPVPHTYVQERILDDLKEYARTAIGGVIEMVMADAPANLRENPKNDELILDQCRDRLLMDLETDVIPRWEKQRPKEFVHFHLGFSDLKSAIWTEGNPSIEDRVSAAFERLVAQPPTVMKLVDTLVASAPFVTKFQMRATWRPERFDIVHRYLLKCHNDTKVEPTIASIYKHSNVDRSDFYAWLRGSDKPTVQERIIRTCTKEKADSK